MGSKISSSAQSSEHQNDKTEAEFIQERKDKKISDEQVEQDIDLKKGVTLKLNNTIPTKYPQIGSANNLKEIIQSHDVMKNYQGREIKYTTEKPNAFQPSLRNGFVSAAIDSFNNHYNLILRPDDVWIAITSQFAIYVEKNAEKLRRKFVDHDGKKDLTVIVDKDTIENEDWPDIVDRFAYKIDKNTKNDVKDWITNDFTTTTQNDRMVSQLLLMGAMQHYFSYTAMTHCGIPQVTLLGTLEDWLKIRQRVNKLTEFGLEEWSLQLSIILDKFVDTINGKGDVAFWNQICDYKYEGGSGGGTFVSGWILAFASFNQGGYYILPSYQQIKKNGGNYGSVRIDDLLGATISVPVQVQDNNGIRELMFYAGIIQNLWDMETKSIRPSVDYAIIDVTQSQELDEESRWGLEIQALIKEKQKRKKEKHDQKIKQGMNDEDLFIQQMIKEVEDEEEQRSKFFKLEEEIQNTDQKQNDNQITLDHSKNEEALLTEFFQ